MTMTAPDDLTTGPRMTPPPPPGDPEETPSSSQFDLGRECVGVSAVKVNLYRDFFEILNGGASSAVSAALTNPFDVLKIRMQVQGELQPRGRYRELYDPSRPLRALRALTAADGARALGAGLGAAVAYNFLMNGVRLGLYSTLERRGLIQHADGRVSVAASAVVSSLGGVVGAVLANPFFLVKCQLMTRSKMGSAAAGRTVVGFQHPHRNTAEAFRALYSSTGVRGLYQVGQKGPFEG